ncbi:MAG: hypothetical protein AAF705_12940 [Bacteroidota bacterium]
MIHKATIGNYSGSMKELAEEIGDLRYDALSDFLNLLADKIERDGDKDKSRDRVKLAKNLHDCSNQLNAAKQSIDQAWIICEPYMK